MAEETILNWKIDESIVAADFISEEGEFGISDYYFEAHSTIAMSKYYIVAQSPFVSNTDREHVGRLLDKIISVDDVFRNTVSYLKEEYRRFQRDFDIGFIADLEGIVRRHRNKDIDDNRYNSLKENYKAHLLSFYTDGGEAAFYRRDLNHEISILINNLEENCEKIVELIHKTPTFILNHLKHIVQTASRIWQLKLFDFSQEADSENIYDASTINHLIEEYDLLLKDLQKDSYGKKRYVKGSSCVAVCFVDDRKCFALSGIDYNPSGNLASWASLQTDDNEKIISLGEAIEKNIGLKYHQLNDETLSYTNDIYGKNIYYGFKGTSLKQYIESLSSSKEQVKMQYSCCERKILSGDPNGNQYLFFIKYLPCVKCLPAVTDKDLRPVRIYTRFNRHGFAESHSKLIQTKVEELSFLDKYKLTEWYYAGSPYTCDF